MALTPGYEHDFHKWVVEYIGGDFHVPIPVNYAIVPISGQLKYYGFCLDARTTIGILVDSFVESNTRNPSTGANVTVSHNFTGEKQHYQGWLGYNILYPFGICQWELYPAVGYGYEISHLKTLASGHIVSLNQSTPPSLIRPANEATYNPKFKGPRVGVQINYLLNPFWKVGINYFHGFIMSRLRGAILSADVVDNRLVSSIVSYYKAKVNHLHTDEFGLLIQYHLGKGVLLQLLGEAMFMKGPKGAVEIIEASGERDTAVCILFENYWRIMFGLNFCVWPR